MVIMTISEDVSLKPYSTMRLGGKADYLTTVTTRQEAAEAVRWAQERQLPFIVIGGGSNLIWDDGGFHGLVIINRIPGVETSGVFNDTTYLTVGAGVSWDSFVAYTTELGLTGLEFLSLIPGTVGATPIQNVGAYGGEVSNNIATIEAYDTIKNKFVNLRGSECGFGYRTSRFKTEDKGRYVITAITFLLQKDVPHPPFYAGLQTYLNEHPPEVITPAAIREAVIAIRQAKLPDPAKISNTGSFFANPIVDSTTYIDLAQDYSQIPHWSLDDGTVKLSAAWLIEQAGFKDYHDDETGMGTWPQQPLVLVNEHATTTAQLKTFRQKIIDAVQQKFNITLQQEPELI